MFFRVLHCNTKKNRIRKFVIQFCITISVRTSELCSLSPVFIGVFSCNTLYYNVLHPRFFVLHCITLYYILYYIVLQRITLYYTHFFALYYIVLHCITLYYIVYYIVLQRITLYYTVYYNVLHKANLYYIVLQRITLYYILYYVVIHL